MLNGKVAVVTGGSRGIGAAIAEKFGSLGASVAIIYNGNEQAAGEVQARIGDNAKIYRCNVADNASCKETVAQIISDFGGVDILVNNAGITRDNLLVTMDEEEFDAVLGTNLKGCFNMIKACGRNFIRKKGGRIINIASVSALVCPAGQANYAASKAGVIALTKSVAREFGGKGICCNAIAPGFVETDMTAELNSDDYLAQIPLKRLGKPEDIAHAAAFLASDFAGYITGEVIRVDGGLAI